MNLDKNKSIEEILGSLDQCTPASAPDFFYTRLKARMESQVPVGRGRKTSLMLRPVYALAGLAAVLIINAFVIFQKNGIETNESTSLSDTETFQSIAAEYSLNDNNPILFDLNQEK